VNDIDIASRPIWLEKLAATGSDEVRRGHDSATVVSVTIVPILALHYPLPATPIPHVTQTSLSPHYRQGDCLTYECVGVGHEEEIEHHRLRQQRERSQPVVHQIIVGHVDLPGSCSHATAQDLEHTAVHLEVNH